MLEKFRNDLADTHIKRAGTLNQIDILITKLEWLKSSIQENDRQRMKMQASNTIDLLQDVEIACKMMKYFCN